MRRVAEKLQAVLGFFGELGNFQKQRVQPPRPSPVSVGLKQARRRAVRFHLVIDRRQLGVQDFRRNSGIPEVASWRSRKSLGGF